MKSIAVDGYSFKLLLEGVEVLFTSANINSSSAGVTCGIDLPANSSLALLSVKTLVHLFFKRRGDDKWRLLFNGEVHSFGFRKTSRGDSFNISCRDISANMNQMYRYFLRKANASSVNSKNKMFYSAPVESGNDFTDIKRAEGDGDPKATEEYTISDIVSIVKKSIVKISTTNKFTKKIEGEYKFSDRFFAMKDKYIETVFSHKSAEAMFNSMSFSNMQTIRDILAATLKDTFYKWCYVSPSMAGRNFREIILIPDNPMFPAPMCNVVFPNMAQNISFSEDAAAKPTRLMMLTAPIFNNRNNPGDSRFQYVAIAPPEIKNFEDQQYLHGTITKEEEISGIMPITDSVPAATKLMNIPKDGDNPKFDEHEGFKVMTQVAEYRLGTIRLSVAGANAGSMPFNPYMAQGFTAVMMVKPFIIRGVLSTVSHSISKQGLSTSITMDHCKSSGYANVSDSVLTGISEALKWSSGSVPVELGDILEAIGEYDFAFPEFASQEYMPAKADKAMTETLGVKTVCHVAKAPDSYPMISCCRKLKDDYEAAELSGNHFDYSKRMTYREVASEEDFFKGLIKVEKMANGDYPVGVYFNKRRQDAILLYRNQIKINPGG